MSINITITTFTELDEWVDAFMRRNGLRLLFLVGNPGVSKSHSVKARLDPEHHHYVKCGRLTAFQLFKQLFTCRDKAVILDDVEDAAEERGPCPHPHEPLRDRRGVTQGRLVRQRIPVGRAGGRQVRPHPPGVRDEQPGLPRVERLGLLLGRFQALLDRGTVVFFDPPPEEIHAFVGRWFRGGEVYDFVGQRLDEISQHSIRYYVIAQEHQRLGLDWRQGAPGKLADRFGRDRPREGRGFDPLRPQIRDRQGADRRVHGTDGAATSPVVQLEKEGAGAETLPRSPAEPPAAGG